MVARPPAEHAHAPRALSARTNSESFSGSSRRSYRHRPPAPADRPTRRLGDGMEASTNDSTPPSTDPLASTYAGPATRCVTSSPTAPGPNTAETPPLTPKRDTKRPPPRAQRLNFRVVSGSAKPWAYWRPNIRLPSALWDDGLPGSKSNVRCMTASLIGTWMAQPETAAATTDRTKERIRPIYRMFESTPPAAPRQTRAAWPRRAHRWCGRPSTGPHPTAGRCARRRLRFPGASRRRARPKQPRLLAAQLAERLRVQEVGEAGARRLRALGVAASAALTSAV